MHTWQHEHGKCRKYCSVFVSSNLRWLRAFNVYYLYKMATALLQQNDITAILSLSAVTVI